MNGKNTEIYVFYKNYSTTRIFVQKSILTKLLKNKCHNSRQEIEEKIEKNGKKNKPINNCLPTYSNQAIHSFFNKNNFIRTASLIFAQN